MSQPRIIDMGKLMWERQGCRCCPQSHSRRRKRRFPESEEGKASLTPSTGAGREPRVEQCRLLSRVQLRQGQEPGESYPEPLHPPLHLGHCQQQPGSAGGLMPLGDLHPQQERDRGTLGA